MTAGTGSMRKVWPLRLTAGQLMAPHADVLERKRAVAPACGLEGCPSRRGVVASW